MRVFYYYNLNYLKTLFIFHILFHYNDNKFKVIFTFKKLNFLYLASFMFCLIVFIKVLLQINNKNLKYAHCF